MAYNLRKLAGALLLALLLIAVLLAAPFSPTQADEEDWILLYQENFNDGQAQGFLADSGIWTVEKGRYVVEPAALGEDAVSVFYVDSYLPSYFEIEATINAGKPTAGLKSNSYLIFDYQSPTDFKFAGINVSIDKLQMGHRDAEGWHVDVQQIAAIIGVEGEIAELGGRHELVVRAARVKLPGQTHRD